MNSEHSDSLGLALVDFVSAHIRDNVSNRLPAVVEKYDAEENTVDCQFLVQIGTKNGEKVDRARVYGVPVRRLGSGGLFVSIPVKVGSLGWLEASDRDLSLIKQRGWRKDWPNTERTHNFADSVFVPDALASGRAVSADALTIQNESGSVYIAVYPDRVELRSPAATVKGNLTVEGTIDCDDVTVATVTGRVSMARHVHDSPAGLTGGPKGV